VFPKPGAYFGNAPPPQRTLPSIDIYEEKNIFACDAWKVIRVSLGEIKKGGRLFGIGEMPKFLGAFCFSKHPCLVFEKFHSTMPPSSTLEIFW
jgi:hypothetical protein